MSFRVAPFAVATGPSAAPVVASATPVVAAALGPSAEGRRSCARLAGAQCSARTTRPTPALTHEIADEKHGRWDEKELRAAEAMPNDDVAPHELDEKSKHGVREQINLEEISLD